MQRIYGISREPRYFFGQNQVDSLIFCVGYHFIETLAVFGGSTGDSLVGVYTGKFPVLTVVYIIREELFLAVQRIYLIVFFG